MADTTGFGGGFVGRSAGEFGEPLMKEFVRCSRRSADALRQAREELDEQRCEVRIALTHCFPVPETLAGDLRRSACSSAAICRRRRSTPPARTWRCTDTRTEHGMTSGGVKVPNVAQPVIGRGFRVYHLQAGTPGRERDRLSVVRP